MNTNLPVRWTMKVREVSENPAARKTTGGGVSFLGLLTLLFIGLKLAGEIDWPWLWVLGPLWIPWALVVGFFGAGLAVLVLLFLAAMTMAMRE